MAKSKIINVRINDELQDKLDKLICDMQKELPRGAEVNVSSLIRGALEQMVEDYEDEKNLVVTAKLNTLTANSCELKAMKELKINEQVKLMKKELDLSLEGVEYNTTVSKRKHNKLKQDLDVINYMIERKEEEGNDLE